MILEAVAGEAIQVEVPAEPAVERTMVYPGPAYAFTTGGAVVVVLGVPPEEGATTPPRAEAVFRDWRMVGVFGLDVPEFVPNGFHRNGGR